MKFSTTESRRLRSQGLKYCPGCKTVLALSDFSTTRGRTGIAPHCKECSRKQQQERSGRPEVQAARHTKYVSEKDAVREKRLRSKFGIGIEEYNKLLESQGGVCAICGGTDKTKALAVDHDHVTGKVRGLLCSRCNPAIGFLMDDKDRARRLVEYLEKWSS